MTATTPHSPPTRSPRSAATTRTLGPRPLKRTTAVARREEKAALLQELEVLRAWLRLRRARQRDQRIASAARTATVGGESLSSPPCSSTAAMSTATAVQPEPSLAFDEPTLARAETYLRLRGAVRDSHLMVASLRGLLCGSVAAPQCEPLLAPLTLPADPLERREMLRLCHAQKIRESDEFIRARCAGMDLRVPYASQEQFQDPATGDLCAVYCEVTPFPGVHCVRDVYDALRFWSSNLEICVSEQLGGAMTVREDTEDDENDEPTAFGAAYSSVRRMRSTLDCGITVGAHQAVFTQVFEHPHHDAARDHVVLVVQPVDADAQYASTPATCNDVAARASCVMRVEHVGDCVVLSRWARIRFRPTAHSTSHVVTPPQLRAALTTGVGRWFEVFQRVVWDYLHATAVARGDPAVTQPLLYPNTSA